MAKEYSSIFVGVGSRIGSDDIVSIWVKSFSLICQQNKVYIPNNYSLWLVSCP